MMTIYTSAYEYLRERGTIGGDPATECSVSVERFPDGERGLRLRDDVSGRDVVLIGGTESDSSTLELYDLACAATKYGARRLTIVVPYFGCSTQERAVKAGDVVTAKTRARLLSSIPRAAQGNRIILFDLHSEGIPYYFEGSILAFHMYGKEFVLQAARAITGGERFVLGATDAGRAKWVESLAKDAGVDPAFVYKRRTSGAKTEVIGVNADVEDTIVVIYDDMIRSGSSLVGAAEAYLAAGAREIWAIATHGVFPGDQPASAIRSSCIKGIAVTDSHPNALRAERISDGFVRVYPLIPILNKKLLELG